MHVRIWADLFLQDSIGSMKYYSRSGPKKHYIHIPSINPSPINRLILANRSAMTRYPQSARFPTHITSFQLGHLLASFKSILYSSPVSMQVLQLSSTLRLTTTPEQPGKYLPEANTPAEKARSPKKIWVERVNFILVFGWRVVGSVEARDGCMEVVDEWMEMEGGEVRCEGGSPGLYTNPSPYIHK